MGPVNHHRGPSSSAGSSVSPLFPSRVSPTPQGRGRDRRRCRLAAELAPATVAGVCEAD